MDLTLGFVADDWEASNLDCHYRAASMGKRSSHLSKVAGLVDNSHSTMSIVDLKLVDADADVTYGVEIHKGRFVEEAVRYVVCHGDCNNLGQVADTMNGCNWQTYWALGHRKACSMAGVEIEKVAVLD